MDNRPVELKPIVAFRESDLIFKLRYQTGVTPPSSISTEFRVDRTRLDVTSTTAPAGQDITVTIPRSEVQSLPTKSDLYIKSGDRYIFGGVVNVLMGAGSPSPGIFEVDNYHGIAVYVTDLAAVQAEVLKAKGYADQSLALYEDILEQLESVAQGPKGEDGQDGQDGQDGTDGVNGETPQFRVDNGFLQTKLPSATVWNNLLNFASLSIITQINQDISAVSQRLSDVETQLNNLPEQ